MSWPQYSFTLTSSTSQLCEFSVQSFLSFSSSLAFPIHLTGLSHWNFSCFFSLLTALFFPFMLGLLEGKIQGGLPELQLHSSEEPCLGNLSTLNQCQQWFLHLGSLNSTQSLHPLADKYRAVLHSWPNWPFL
jgi:hypothetical protein